MRLQAKVPKDQVQPAPLLRHRLLGLLGARDLLCLVGLRRPGNLLHAAACMLDGFDLLRGSRGLFGGSHGLLRHCGHVLFRSSGNMLHAGCRVLRGACQLLCSGCREPGSRSRSVRSVRSF